MASWSLTGVRWAAALGRAAGPRSLAQLLPWLRTRAESVRAPRAQANRAAAWQGASCLQLPSRLGSAPKTCGPTLSRGLGIPRRDIGSPLCTRTVLRPGPSFLLSEILASGVKALCELWGAMPSRHLSVVPANRRGGHRGPSARPYLMQVQHPWNRNGLKSQVCF